MLATESFTTADQTRFAEIKARIQKLLPKTRPRSEDVHALARLFVEVRDKGYQRMDGEAECILWMWRCYRVGDRQARKYFAAAGLPAAEVEGKRQGIEVMGQIAQEEDLQVRRELWELAESLGATDKVLCAGRRKARPYLRKGRRAQGIEALQKEVAARMAEEERKKCASRPAGEPGTQAMAKAMRALARLAEGKDSGMIC